MTIHAIYQSGVFKPQPRLPPTNHPQPPEDLCKPTDDRSLGPYRRHRKILRGFHMWVDWFAAAGWVDTSYLCFGFRQTDSSGVPRVMESSFGIPERRNTDGSLGVFQLRSSALSIGRGRGS